MSSDLSPRILPPVSGWSLHLWIPFQDLVSFGEPRSCDLCFSASIVSSEISMSHFLMFYAKIPFVTKVSPYNFFCCCL